jgi:flagellar hook protein FlgE
VRVGGNLPADVPEGTVIAASINVFNSLGTAVPLRIEFTKTTDTTELPPSWDARVYSGTTLVSGPHDVDFNTAGELTTDSILLSATDLNDIPGTAGTWATSGLELDFGEGNEANRMTGASGQNSAAALSQNGSAIGTLVSFSVAQDGLISGVFSNGRNQPLGQIALAAFSNPPGMERAGGSMWRSTVNSGEPLVGVAGSGGRGTLAGGTLEMSNVDLAAEFTNLIVAQRGFQANSRIITASDEILQDLVNMKR